MFKPQEELVVRDFVRFAAPALLEHNRMGVVDPQRHAADLERKCTRNADQEPQHRHANKQLLTARWLQTQEQPKTCHDHVLSGERR